MYFTKIILSMSLILKHSLNALEETIIISTLLNIYLLQRRWKLEYWYKDFYKPDDKAKCYIAMENDLISTPPFEIHALKISKENHFIVFASGMRGGKDYESDTFRVDPII